MKPTEVIRRYVDAWNSHDASTFRAAFTKDGTYCNPYTHPGVSGDALADFAKAVYTAFPDFHVELLNAGEIEPGIVATHWLLTCTNTGQRIEGPPTGRSISIKGAAIIQLEGDKIASDHTSYDRAAFDEQLQPKASE
jgi:steroid delta-isomerase-like uncharacterized protein